MLERIVVLFLPLREIKRFTTLLEKFHRDPQHV